MEPKAKKETVRRNITMGAAIYERALEIMEICAYADFSEMLSALVREKHASLHMQPRNEAPGSHEEQEAMRQTVKRLKHQASETPRKQRP